MKQPVFFCTSCGAQNPVNAPKCWRCGAVLQQFSNTPPPAIPVVPIEKQASPPPIPARTPEPVETAPAGKKKRRLKAGGIIGIIAGVLVLFGLCLAVSFVLKNLERESLSFLSGSSKPTQQAKATADALALEALASLEPFWEPYSSEGPLPVFQVVKIVQPAMQAANYDPDYQFMFEVMGRDPSQEECQAMSYQCGDADWQPATAGMSLNSGCKVKITEGTYCHFLLPDNSLLTAYNTGDEYDLVSEDEGETDLIFQINLGAEETRIIQKVTLTENAIIHRLPEGHELPYFIEIGDYEIESLGTGGVTGNPDFSGNTIQDAKIGAQVLWGKAKIRKSPKLYPDDKTETVISKGQSVQTVAYIADQCPYPYAPCGDGCIPRTNTCCAPEQISGRVVTGSWCTSRFTTCVPNYGNKSCTVTGLGPMTDNFQHSSSPSSFCCEPPVAGYTGSKDVLPGTRFCGLNTLIGADEDCCYNGKCAKANQATLTAQESNKFTNNFTNNGLENFHAFYHWMNDVYQQNLDRYSDDPITKMIAGTQKMAEATIVQAVADKEQQCKLNPNWGFCKTENSSPSSSSSSSSSSSGSFDCSPLISVFNQYNIKVSCDCSKTSGNDAWCTIDVSNVANWALVEPMVRSIWQSYSSQGLFSGSGWFPKDCGCR